MPPSDVGAALLPGAGLGGWIWEPVIPLLHVPALAVEIPGRAARPADRRRVTLESAADAIAGDIGAWEPGRIVLVGHSLGGVFLPEVARRVPDRIAALVFVAAEAPVDGDRALDLIPAPLRILLRVMWIVRPGGVRPPPSATRRALCNDLDDATTATVVERIEPEAPGVYRDRVTWAGVPEVPRTYVKCLQDRSDISPARQDEMAKRLQADRVVPLETGHLPMLARPGELALVLEEAVAQVA
jgi:pimeloyl-ACP methyl ester carboxylesterase